MAVNNLNANMKDMDVKYQTLDQRVTELELRVEEDDMSSLDFDKADIMDDDIMELVINSHCGTGKYISRGWKPMSNI